MASVTEVLGRVVAALPGGGEARPGQRRMAEAVADAIRDDRHLLVQAGTGTGKSLGYLVPAVLSGRRVVVATVTKALQDQLAGKDLPQLAADVGRPVRWAVLKGRSNYVCRQRVEELRAASLELDDVPGAASLRREVADLAAWSVASPSGDRSELEREPSHAAWAAVSVAAEECPGAQRCPRGDVCFAEAARRRAAEADVVVVNTHLYGMHLASGGAVLPEHDVVVFDEAHQLEEVISATAGLQLGAGRFVAAARATASVVADDALADSLAELGPRWTAALAPHVGRRLRRGLAGEAARVAELARSRTAAALEALHGVDPDAGDDVAQRRLRAQLALHAVVAALDAVAGPGEDDVTWVEGTPSAPVVRVAPVDVGPTLAGGVWDRTTAILTSATLGPALPERLGLDPGSFASIDVGSPFDYEANALLYCAAHLPDPRSEGADDARHAELAALIDAAGGRTLALFTSWRAMRAAADALTPVLPYRVLTQADLPKPALLAAFSEDETSCLFATLGFWQGVDVPGAALSLVTIDRLPFPRPDEPLLQARRERARAAAFTAVDLPRAVTLLAQGAGRLIRTAGDRGVVAVLDPRLATAGYRWDVVRALPPMRRTRHRAEAEAFLRSLHAEPAAR